jgi:hypothetical protein
MKRSRLPAILILMSAVIPDPGTVRAGMAPAVSPSSARCRADVQAQALACDPFLSDHLPAVGRSEGQAMQRMLGHHAERGSVRLSRRGVLVLAGGAAILAGGDWALKRYLNGRRPAVRPIPAQTLKEPPAPALTLARTPRLILDFLDARQDLIPEVREMLKRGLLPTGTVRNIAEYRETVAEMRRILTLAEKEPSRVIEITDDVGAGFAVRVGVDGIAVNLKVLPIMLKENEELLFHEILHATPSLTKMILRTQPAKDHLNQNLFILTNPKEFVRHPELQAETWQVLKANGLWERRSYFAQMAMVDLKADRQGLTPLRYTFDRLLPAAEKAGVSVPTLVENAARRDSGLDPAVRTMAAEYSFATYYKRGDLNSINPRVVRALAGQPGLATLPRALINLPPSMGGPRAGEVWFDWLARMLFQDSPRKRADILPAPANRAPDALLAAA